MKQIFMTYDSYGAIKPLDLHYKLLQSIHSCFQWYIKVQKSTKKHKGSVKNKMYGLPQVY